MAFRSGSGSALLSDPHRRRSYNHLRFGPMSCSSFGEIPCHFALALVLLFSEIRNVAGLQVHEPWADLVSFSAGEITRRFSVAFASLACQTCNVAGAVPEPAKQSCILRKGAVEAVAPVQVRAEQ
jgi:hypothetical protein